MKDKLTISILIPCYNEEMGLKQFNNELFINLPKNYNYEIIYINDGSKDETLTILKELQSANNQINYISLSRNFGHQNALKAGYDYATGECAICLDADLQHPPELIPTLIDKWKEGFEVVTTIRKDHESIPFFKKITSGLFYKISNLISDVKIEQGAADFRLIDRKVLEELKKFNENYIFLRGQINWIGFQRTTIEYYAGERFAGSSKYTLKKMAMLATSGITSFSVKPLKLSMYMGGTISMLAFIYGLYALFVYLFTNNAIAGWTSVLVSILLIGGINLLMIGIIGEYLGKLFIENKKRPNYIVSEAKLKSVFEK
jgi:dolichol-phosphate mannosyltransferase